MEPLGTQCSKDVEEGCLYLDMLGSSGHGHSTLDKQIMHHNDIKITLGKAGKAQRRR